MKKEPPQKKKLARSFAFALSGILLCLRRERNLRIHFGLTLLVSAAGFLLHISALEWLVCLLCFALVLGAELVNTAVEAAVDLSSPERNEKARLAKDAAAGAVLVCAVFSAAAGLIIFLPKLWALFAS